MLCKAILCLLCWLPCEVTFAQGLLYAQQPICERGSCSPELFFAPPVSETEFYLRSLQPQQELIRGSFPFCPRSLNFPGQQFGNFGQTLWVAPCQSFGTCPVVLPPPSFSSPTHNPPSFQENQPRRSFRLFIERRSGRTT